MILKLKKHLLATNAFLAAAIESLSGKRQTGKAAASIDWNAGLDFEDDFWNPEAAHLDHARVIEPGQPDGPNPDEQKEMQNHPKRFARSNTDHWFSPRGATPYKSTQRFP